MSKEQEYTPETLVVSSGRPDHEHDAPVNPPVVLSSTFRGTGTVSREDLVYARFDNPSWNGLEEVVADLEGAQLPGLLFASGMAAVAAVMELVPVGATILLPKHTYMASVTIAEKLQERGIVSQLVRLDIEDTPSVLADLRKAAQEKGCTPQNINYSAPKVLLWLESPTNPMLEVADLPAILAEAKKLGIVSAVDNTFSTPLVQQPLALGADIVVHSATKYLAGHSDVLLGISVTSNEELHKAMYQHRTSHGAIAGPFEAWLGLRGIRTLALRVNKAMENAHYLAQKLQQHPAVAQVRYPGLSQDPGHQRAKKQMKGYGAVLCIVLKAGAVETEEVVKRLKIWTPGTSLGGVESLIERRRRHGLEPDSIPESLLRLAVGIESAQDLYRDLEQALASLVQ